MTKPLVVRMGDCEERTILKPYSIESISIISSGNRPEYITIIDRAGKSPATVEAISLDMILAIEHAGLVPRNCTLRCWMQSVLPNSVQAYLFLDAGETVLKEASANFFLSQVLGSPIDIYPSGGRFAASQYSNRSILVAYARNLQECLSRRDVA
jgi:hypothetical protein